MKLVIKTEDTQSSASDYITTFREERQDEILVDGRSISDIYDMLRDLDILVTDLSEQFNHTDYDYAVEIRDSRY